MFQLSKKPTYLSYSAVDKFETDPEEYFLSYLTKNRPDRLPQEAYMGVGSGFDAKVKAELYAALFGPGSDPAFEYDALFEEQVEPQNRDFCAMAGLHVFESYVSSGAYHELLALLEKSIEPPKFETKVEGLLEGVPFMGKPDCRFVLQFPDYDPVRIILDWKVKGYCSKYGASPSKGYAMCRDGYKAAKQSQSHGKEHKQYLATDHRGFTVNSVNMEACNSGYADQVSSYGWLLGEGIGDENVVVWIDEIVAKYMEENPPLLRVANHRARVSREYQLKLMGRIKRCWDAVQSGHIFLDMTPEESADRCEVLEMTAVGLKTDGSAEEDFFNECTRNTRYKG